MTAAAAGAAAASTPESSATFPALPPADDGPYQFGGRMRGGELLRWREEFPILKRMAQLSSCSQSAQSVRVKGSIDKYMELWLQKGMDWDSWCDEVVRAKSEFAKLIGAGVDEIAAVMSVSDALGGVASALDFSKSRNKVVATESEFPTVGHVWLANQKNGCRVDFVPVRDSMVDLNEYERFIDDTTLITSVTHTYYLNGFKQDIGAIADIAHRKGSLIFVDGYQACGSSAIDVKKQKIDMYATGQQKFLFGVPGIAFLYVSRDLAPMLKPAMTGWFGQENPFAFRVRELDFARGARRFDTGTPPALAGYAASAGMQIINEVGMDVIEERIAFLSQVAIAEADKRGLDMISPRDPARKGSNTAIRLTMNSHDMEVELAKRGVVASARGNVIRIAPHFYNTASEVIYAMEQIKQIIDVHQR